MPIYRYKIAGIGIEKLKKQVPPADVGSISSENAASLVVWDVTAPATSKDDIDDYLLTLGWEFVETDPTDTPQEAADASITHDDLSGAGTNTHAQVDSHIASTANPHSVTAAQAGAAPSAEGVTNGNSHDHSGGDGSQIDHTTLSNKGTNTHAQIDTHLAATAPHSGHASTDHDATHIRAGSDEIDGDKLDIDWNPSNYTPATTPTEVDNVDHLTAHLYGIDQKLVATAYVFGSEYDYEEKTSSQSTTSTSFVNYMTMTTASLPAGTYRIGWMYVWRYSDANDEFQCRVQVDNTTNLINPGDSTYKYHRQEPTDGRADQRMVNTGFRHVSLGSGVHTIDIDFGGDGDTAYMYHGQIEIWRVS